MEWIATPESSNIVGFGYETVARILLVEFKGGSRYKYLDVPAQIFERMKASPSKGRFLAKSVKGIYRDIRA